MEDAVASESGSSSALSSQPTSPASGRVAGLMKEAEVDAENDPRLLRALEYVRGLESAQLKEQCVMTEWAAAESEDERDLLAAVVREGGFWTDVQRMTDDDMAAMPVEEERVDMDERLRQMFRCFDKDNSGTIDTNELHQMLLYMGLPSSDRDVKAMMARADVSGDGAIDMDEFLTVMKDAQGERLGESDARTAAEAIKAISFRLTQKRTLPPRVK